MNKYAIHRKRRYNSKWMKSGHFCKSGNLMVWVGVEMRWCQGTFSPFILHTSVSLEFTKWECSHALLAYLNIGLRVKKTELKEPANKLIKNHGFALIWFLFWLHAECQMIQQVFEQVSTKLTLQNRNNFYTKTLLNCSNPSAFWQGLT